MAAHLAAHGDLEAGQETDRRFRVAGRILSRRREHGKAVFFTIRDGWDDFQLYANVTRLGQDSFDC